MLLRSIRPFKDYSGTQTIPAGIYFTVYAIERDKGQLYYYTLPYGVKHSDGEYDPLFFEAENFEVIADLVTKEWITKNTGSHGHLTTTSFPEWFKDEFGLKAHDWDLEDDDYPTIIRYKKQYEELYKEYVPKNRSA